MRNLEHYFTLTCSVLRSSLLRNSLPLILSLTILVAQAQPPEDAVVGWWTFEKGVEMKDLTGNFDNIILKGAKVENGKLDVDNGKWAYSGGYKGPDIKDKTLVSWAYIQDLNVRAGSIITIDRISSDHFDGIIFAEREVGRWMPGSSGFGRTQNPVPGFEEKKTNVLVHMAISYEDKGGQAHIKIYHDGDLIGEYTQGGIGSWVKGDAEVFFGLRHGSEAGGGPGNLDALIEDSRIYNQVLSRDEIKDLAPNRLGKAVTSRGKLATSWAAIKAK